MQNNQAPQLSLEGFCPLLQVFDMARSLQFYRDILQFKVVSASSEDDDADWVLLEYNGISLMLNTLYEKENRPQEPDVDRYNVHQDVILYFGSRDIDSAYRYLLSKDIDVDAPSITGYAFRAISFKDPDGYAICIHWPNEKNN